MCHIFAGDRKASLLQHLPIAVIQGIRGQCRHEIRAQGSRSAQGFVPPPPRDGAVVPGQQNRGHLTPAPYPWPGKNGALQQAGHGPVPAAKRIVGSGGGIAKHPGRSLQIASIMTSTAGSPPDST